MFGIVAFLENEKVFLEVRNSKLLVKNDHTVIKSINLREIKSLHTKNTDRFFLRINLDTSEIVFEYDNHHARDVSKSILLASIKTEGEILKKMTDTSIKSTSHHSITTHPITSPVKPITNSSTSKNIFLECNNSKIKEMMAILNQSPMKEISLDTKEFVSSLPPLLLKIFCDMNCSVTQFYNLLSQSNFINIRNKFNSVDRMITDYLRKYEVKQNYATRINNYSLLSCGFETESHFETKKGNPKELKFEAVYPFDQTDDHIKGQTNIHTNSKTDGHIKGILECNIKLGVDEVEASPLIEEKDLIQLRDLCRIAFRSKKELKEEAVRLGEEMRVRLRKKYGEVEYFKRILPSYYANP